ncbi:MAG: alpha/beta fold hydrolase [Gammaproteobacteria bacterium]
MRDGFKLPLRVWKSAIPPTAIVLALHGMNDYSRVFEKTGTHLSKKTMLVYAYDQRGFGSTAKAGYWHGSQQMIDDAILAIALLKQRHPKIPLYLLGESMGGAVTLLAQNAHLAGTILVAPAVWSRASMPWYQRLGLWFAVRTVPDKKLTGKGLDIQPTDNVDMLRAWSRDPLVIKATRVDALYGVSNLMDSAAEIALNQTVDTLLLYGMNDDIIPKNPVCQLAASAFIHPGRKLDTVHYTMGYHMLTRDLQAEEVLNDITSWIQNREILRSNTNPPLDCS